MKYVKRVYFILCIPAIWVIVTADYLGEVCTGILDDSPWAWWSGESGDSDGTSAFDDITYGR